MLKVLCIIVLFLLILIFFIDFVTRRLEYKKIEEVIKRYNLEIDKKIDRGNNNGRSI